ALARVGYLEGHVMEAFAALLEEAVQKGVCAQRFEQLDHRSAEVELGVPEAGLLVGMFVHAGCAERAFVKLACLGDASDRQCDVVERSDRSLGHALRPSCG